MLVLTTFLPGFGGSPIGNLPLTTTPEGHNHWPDAPLYPKRGHSPFTLFRSPMNATLGDQEFIQIRPGAVFPRFMPASDAGYATGRYW